MKFWAVFRKNMLELLREPLLISLTLIFAPFFVLLYRLWFPSGSTSYTLLLLNQDRPVLSAGKSLSAGAEVAQALETVTYKDGSQILQVRSISSRAEAEPLLRDRRAAALLILPEGFSNAIAGLRLDPNAPPAPYTLVGDLSNPAYAIAAVLSAGAVEGYIQSASGRASPARMSEEALGASAARSEFENYVPGLLVFAVIMLIFQTAMAVAREVESGALRRISLSRVRAFDLLGGISLAQVAIGVLSVGLTLLSAVALGFHSQGPVWVALLVGALTALSVVGLGLIVACFARTVTTAFLVANFPLALLMFFSGAIYPVPKVVLFNVLGRDIGAYDFLPASHAVVALNKVLALGAGLNEVGYELSALCILSLLYFGLGVWLFQRMHLRR
jgi:ABC-2 type transport system permease protein